MGRLRFKTSPVKVLVTVVLLAAFTALGFWQLHRAQEKMEIRDRVESGTMLSVLDITSNVPDSQDMAFRQARARGRYLGDFQIFLDNKVHQGKAGYHVLTPLMLADGDTVLLVNRGWVAWEKDRWQVPEIAVPEDRIEVSGRLVPPSRNAISFEDRSGEFQRVWQNLDLEQYASLTGFSVFGLTLLLSPEDDAGDGLVRRWKVSQDDWIQRHQAYAAQWFGLALVLVVLFLYFSFTRETHDETPKR